MIIAGLGYMAVGGALDSVEEPLLIPILLPVAVSMAIIGVVSLVIGLVLIFVGWKLFKEVEWAYWLTFVLSIIGVGMSLYIMNWWGVLIGGLIAIYCWMIMADFREGARDWSWRRD